MPSTMRSLDPLFHPRAVAVIGATSRAGSIGSILMRNLLATPFGGVVYPVNPKRRAVHGVYCYPSLKDLPGPVDLAVIATPAATVPAVIQECADNGVKGAIVISAGFSELGAPGRALEEAVRVAARGRLRVIGPNCLGIIHPASGLNASFATGTVRPGPVALLSQSGAICTAILDWARAAQVGFRSFVSVGTMLDVDFADLIDYFADDPGTRSIVLYIESIGGARKFLSAARAAARSKPIIVVKAGRHEAGARAAASHTGALAGADAVFDAAFRRAGLLRVDTIPDLFHMAEILAMQPQPAGPALAILTNAGGPGVMATDALMTRGGRLPALRPETVTALNACLPPYWSHANPVDLLGDATPERYRRAVEICAQDPGVQGLLVLLTPQAMADPTDTARQLVPFAQLPGKPVLASWMGAGAVEAGCGILNAAGIPTFRSPEDAVGAFLHMVQYRRNQELLYETPEAVPEQTAVDPDRVRRVLAVARAENRTLLTEVEAKEVLNAYNITVVPTVAARTPDDAVAAAQRTNYPVVVKLLSRTVTHKSDVGGVYLNLGDDQAVRRAYHAIATSVAQQAPEGAFEGVTVQPMVRGQGYELILGSSVDRQFGPVVLFGAGGVLVEVFHDQALALPPLTRTLARRLMERTQIAHALMGTRGRREINLEALEVLLVRFSQLVADFLDIQEIDINPLLALPEGLVALDARVILAPADLPPDQRPRLAIRPYPNQYVSTARLADGTEVVIRPVRPEDEPLIVELHASHSERTIRMRFFSLVKTLSRDSLIRLCHLDYEREMALAAVRTQDGRPHFCGVARYYQDPETAKAEFAVVVNDAYQRRGLARQLMDRLIAIARERGVKRLTGLVLHENTPMIRFVQKLGFSVELTGDPTVVEAVLDLSPGR